MELSKSAEGGISFRSAARLIHLPVLAAMLMLVSLTLQQQQQYRHIDNIARIQDGDAITIDFALLQQKIQPLQQQQRRLTSHRRVKHKSKTTSIFDLGAGKNQHIDDLRTSWGSNSLLLRQQEHNHHSISIGKNYDIFPIPSTLQDTNDEYRYQYWTTRHRHHHSGKGDGGKGKGGNTNGKGKEGGKGGKGKGKGEGGVGKGKGEKGKGKGEGKGDSELNCLGKGGNSSKSKSHSHGKGGKGKGSTKTKYGKGTSKSKNRRLKGKGGYGKGKGGHGKGKGGKGKGGGKGSDTYYYDDDNYVNDECLEDIIRPPTINIPMPPMIVPAPITITNAPTVVVPTSPPVVVTPPPTSRPVVVTPPAIAITSAPSATTSVMTTTGPTPERGLVSVRVSDWYIAFRAPDATTRAPTREEYELVLEGTRVYLEMYFQDYFMTNMLDNVIYVRTDSMLGNAAYGLDVPPYVPQPSMVDNERVNIYVQFRFVEFFYVDTSDPIPNEAESYALIQEAIRDMESTYIAQVPATLVGTPFESTIDTILDRVP